MDVYVYIHKKLSLMLSIRRLSVEEGGGVDVKPDSPTKTGVRKCLYNHVSIALVHDCNVV